MDKRFIEESFPVKEVSKESCERKKYKPWTYFNFTCLVG